MDQRNACEGKRTTKRHPPIAHPSPHNLISTNKTPTACAGKRQSRLRDSGVNMKCPSPASTTTYLFISTYTKPLTNITKRLNPDQGTYVGMKYTTLYGRPFRGSPLISAYLIFRNQQRIHRE